MPLCVYCKNSFSEHCCCKCKKPRATAKNFPDASLVQARKLAKTANQIVDVLWPFSHKTRVKIISQAIVKLGS